MYLEILGSGQDAGVPQIGCLCSNCLLAHKDPNYRKLASSIAVIDDNHDVIFIIDASPDIKYQYYSIYKKKKNNDKISEKNFPPIFLTHTHYGHLAGLWLLGKECLDANSVKVYCSPKVKKFLETSHPFIHLISRKNILPTELAINETLQISNCTIESFEVPHRNEYADTVGYQITNNKRIVYLPDLDSWNKELIERISRADIALIDGTFYSNNEIPSYSHVPHPPIIETMQLFSNLKTKIIFTHFNHTNPILNDESIEKSQLINNGFKIAHDNMQIMI
ncbi:MAG: MBL fold metallo-hydrolase [Candidatus Thorarchaeota archaeon]